MDVVTETLLHATTQIISEKERVIIHAAYAPTMFRTWPNQGYDPRYLETLEEEQKVFLSGGNGWPWRT